MRFGRVHPYFWSCGFWRERREASLFVVIMGHVDVSISMLKTDVKNVMAASHEVKGLVMVG
jgi:hypothetical protein